MQNFKKISFIVLIEVANKIIIFVGDSLKCYNCISKSSKECLDPKSNEHFKPQECDVNKINHLAEQAKNIAQDLGRAFGIDITPSQTQDVPLVCQKIVTSGKYLCIYIMF